MADADGQVDWTSTSTEARPEVGLHLSAAIETVPLSTVHPVDTPAPPTHRVPVSKKPHKVAEPSSPYPAKKPVKAEPAVKYADTAKVKETNAKLMQVHRVVLQKLAR